METLHDLQTVFTPVRASDPPSFSIAGSETIESRQRLEYLEGVLRLCRHARLDLHLGQRQLWRTNLSNTQGVAALETHKPT